MVTPPYSTVISPNDHMWKTGQPWYFDVGLSALECIKRALATADLTPDLHPRSAVRAWTCLSNVADGLS